MANTLNSKIIERLPGISAIDPSELELHFLTGAADLKKFAQNKNTTPPAGFADAARILKFVRKFSNFPNLLKKRNQLEAFFTETARKHAGVTLLSTPYLGVDAAARDYFLPVEFRIYWALMIGMATGGRGALDKVVKQIAAKKLIRNKTEFAETLARIR